MPYVMTIMFASFPSGLMIYWIISNTFSIVQQYILSKKSL
jgi:YidC/Oxa1 family membrane protein insertase